MRLKDVCLIALSIILLILSFPKFDHGFLAWVGLSPLLITLMGKSLSYSFLLSLTCGVLSFVGIFNWILAMPKFILLQQIPLGLYLGSYFGLFGLAFNFISTRWSLTPALWAAPFIWVSLEYIRSNLSFLALPWGLLAHSQHGYPTIIQIASITGAYGISLLIVMVNAALAAIIYPYLSKFSGQKIPPNLPLEKGGVTIPAMQIGRPSGEMSTPTPALPHQRGRKSSLDKGTKVLVVVAALLFILVFTYGQLTIPKSITGERVKISLVQGNIEQVKKWDTKFAQKIMQEYSELTEKVSREKPSLIIWPETATPRSIGQSPMVYKAVKNIAKNSGTYLLLGSADQQKFSGKGSMKEKCFNSAYLIHPDPQVARNQRYDKIRLFPFGEYLPYKDIIPWSLIHVRDSGEYTPGNEFTVFEMPEARFSVVICWEDVFPELFRQFVKRGAQFMVNITNEAHFGKTAAPYQLASISVFRAVENRIFVIRCANTGVSCIIDPYGRIVDRVKDEKGEDTFVRGVMSGWIIPLESKTIYTQYGDLLVWVAIFGTLVMLGVSFWKGRVE